MTGVQTCALPISEEIELATDWELPGWLPYFDETVGGPQNDWYLRPASTLLKNATAESNREFIGRLRPELSGTNCESMVRYHRPIVEDGTIEYEFYYEPARILAHPTLDRLCFLLDPEGIAIHWVTDGRFDPSGIDPGNQTQEPTHRQGNDPLPLIADQWNKVSLAIQGDTVGVELNGNPVYSRELEPTNLRTFGLFHYADQTEARVRNIRWRGDWPKKLPVPVEQELAGDEVDELIGDSNSLPLVFDHDFRNGVPSELFFVAGDKWEENLKQLSNGIQLTRPTGEYVSYAVVSPVILTGDFDITAAFENFASQKDPNGDSSIQLAVTLDDDRSREVLLFRRMYGVPPNTCEQLVQAAIFEKRGGDTQFLFFNNPPEESTAGRMRLIRRGSKLSCLYAEDDSTEFRLIQTETVSDANATVKLLVAQHKAGFAQVVWKNLSVRAQSSLGGPEKALKTIAELNKERSALPAERVFNFATPKPVAGTDGLNAFSVWSHTSATYASDKDGLTITVPGSENWQAAGLVPRVALAGDFDISLELDVLHMEPCKPNDESVVLLQTEFNDKRKSNSEVKFSIHNGGDRKAETQQRRIRGDGTFNYQEIVSRPEATATLLRLARRGDVIYQIFQSDPDSSPEVLGAMKMGTDPVPLGLLRALIHTGGDNRKTVIRFKSFRIRAEQIVDG